MNNKGISTIIGLMLLAGCSRDYTPESAATGETIFQQACAECHQADDKDGPNSFFTLNDKNANPTYIAHKVHTGSIIMPKFPNIKGKKMRALSEYVLEHSSRK
jgi:cytochrome c551